MFREETEESLTLERMKINESAMQLLKSMPRSDDKELNGKIEDFTAIIRQYLSNTLEYFHTDESLKRFRKQCIRFLQGEICQIRKKDLSNYHKLLCELINLQYDSKGEIAKKANNYWRENQSISEIMSRFINRDQIFSRYEDIQTFTQTIRNLEKEYDSLLHEKFLEMDALNLRLSEIEGNLERLEIEICLLQSQKERSNLKETDTHIAERIGQKKGLKIQKDRLDYKIDEINEYYTEKLVLKKRSIHQTVDKLQEGEKQLESDLKTKGFSSIGHFNHFSIALEGFLSCFEKLTKRLSSLSVSTQSYMLTFKIQIKALEYIFSSHPRLEFFYQEFSKPQLREIFQELYPANESLLNQIEEEGLFGQMLIDAILNEDDLDSDFWNQIKLENKMQKLSCQTYFKNLLNEKSSKELKKSIITHLENLVESL